MKKKSNYKYRVEFISKKAVNITSENNVKKQKNQRENDVLTNENSLRDRLVFKIDLFQVYFDVKNHVI